MTPDRRISSSRRRVLDQARDLARSGAYADHESIVEALRQMEGFHFAEKRLQQYAIVAQLDRICRMARETRQSGEEDDAKLA